jgi:hypothetical protein
LSVAGPSAAQASPTKRSHRNEGIEVDFFGLVGNGFAELKVPGLGRLGLEGRGIWKRRKQ